MCPGWGRCWFATFPPWRDCDSRGTLRTYARTTHDDDDRAGIMATVQAAYDGHALRLTETNSRGYIAVCACGWSGKVHETREWQPYRGAKWRPNRAQSMGAALREYGAHADGERAAAKARARERAERTVRRNGRFSHA